MITYQKKDLYNSNIFLFWKRANEEGLNGRKRMYKIKQKKIGPGRKKYKSRKSNSKKRKKKYSDKIIKH